MLPQDATPRNYNRRDDEGNRFTAAKYIVARQAGVPNENIIIDRE